MNSGFIHSNKKACHVSWTIAAIFHIQKLHFIINTHTHTDRLVWSDGASAVNKEKFNVLNFSIETTFLNVPNNNRWEKEKKRGRKWERNVTRSRCSLADILDVYLPDKIRHVGVGAVDSTKPWQKGHYSHTDDTNPSNTLLYGENSCW